MFSLYYDETKRTTGAVETNYLFFCPFSRLMRKQADKSGATREEIRSYQVKDDKVMPFCFLNFVEHIVHPSCVISLACVYKAARLIICNGFFALGGSPLYRLYGYVRCQRVWFFSRFGLK